MLIKWNVPLYTARGETAINLSTGEPNRDFGFKNPEADTMLLSVYARLRANGNTGVLF